MFEELPSTQLALLGQESRTNFPTDTQSVRYESKEPKRLQSCYGLEKCKDHFKTTEEVEFTQLVPLSARLSLLLNKVVKKHTHTHKQITLDLKKTTSVLKARNKIKNIYFLFS